MRLEKILPLILIATLSRDLRITGTRPSVASQLAPDKATVVLPNKCGDTLEAASPAESFHFLNKLSGQWYAGLQVALLEGSEIIQDGFTIGSEAFSPSRFVISDDEDLVKTTKSMTIPRSMKIGREDKDGFRLLQLNFAKSGDESKCVFYAVKLVHEASLLVRGPTPISSNPDSTMIDGEPIRIHYRFRNSSLETRAPIGQTAALSGH